MNPLALIVVLSLCATGGLIVAVTGWRQPAPTLVGAIRHLRRTPPSDYEASDAGQPRHKYTTAVVGQLRRRPGLLPPDTDLRLIDRTSEQHVLLGISLAALGLALPGLLVVVMQRARVVDLGWVAPLVVSLALAVLAPVMLHVATLERAGQVRADLRYQLSAYLDVVTMLLAGNTGYEGALEQASRAGDGRLFAELRRRIRDAATRGASLTEALMRTGEELGLDELEQVAATAALSAAEGAPVARTLAAKCATLRNALATEQESEARLRTSRLTTPIVGMALIFMALVIYPALSFS